MAEGGGAPLGLDEAIARYGELIRSVVRRVGGRRVALVEDDIRQQVVIALWKQLRGEPNIERPASYVYRAAVRETVRAVRRELARPWAEATESDAVATAEAGSNPEQALEAAGRVEAVEQALVGLTPERARAVRAHLDGWSVEEIMRLNGWPYQKARNLIARGMAGLRAALRARGIHG